MTNTDICAARTQHLPFSASRARLNHPVMVRDLPSYTHALAIIVPRRTYATETTTHGGDGGAFPPPGFNVNEAKKPPPQRTDNPPSAKEIDAQPNEQHKVSKTEPTAVDKTTALENMTLSELAEAKESATAKPDEKAAIRKEEDKRLTLGQKIKRELQHYWDGTKLLATEIKISSKLALKMAAGYELSRRENRQVSISNLCVYAIQISDETIRVASTYNSRSCPISTILRLRHHSFRRITYSCRSETLPELSSIHL